MAVVSPFFATSLLIIAASALPTPANAQGREPYAVIGAVARIFALNLGFGWDDKAAPVHVGDDGFAQVRLPYYKLSLQIEPATYADPSQPDDCYFAAFEIPSRRVIATIDFGYVSDNFKTIPHRWGIDVSMITINDGGRYPAYQSVMRPADTPDLGLYEQPLIFRGLVDDTMQMLTAAFQFIRANGCPAGIIKPY